MFNISTNTLQQTLCEVLNTVNIPIKITADTTIGSLQIISLGKSYLLSFNDKTIDKFTEIGKTVSITNIKIEEVSRFGNELLCNLTCESYFEFFKELFNFLLIYVYRIDFSIRGKRRHSFFFLFKEGIFRLCPIPREKEIKIFKNTWETLNVKFPDFQIENFHCVQNSMGMEETISEFQELTEINKLKLSVYEEFKDLLETNL